MRFGIYPNLGKADLQQALTALTGLLRLKKIDYSFPISMRKGLMEMGFTEETYETEETMGQRDFILSVGGDGSFLGAARTFADYPVLMAGLHLGDLGFLNSITLSDLEKRMDQILAGDFKKEQRLYLSSRIVHEDRTEETLPHVLNDVVIGHNSIGQLARIRLFINDSFIQEYAADGLIISSPTGSTGYSLSCGGPVLGPSDDRIIIVPICAHTLQRFAMVLSRDDVVKIRVPEREKNLSLSLDGAYTFSFTNKDTLYVKSVEKPIRFLRFQDQDFFGSITRKLVRKVADCGK
ncbi:NAD(+)/NADH kinase [uncultured Dialister sp.]|uniref:NAD(+)/NADH kinase n=1 Tax=uncultured Dialister sp. TaxID=278064 RepID=UPI002612474C|nr:NAD(+)/NADH kinase [uncultured Dialister sp.]